LTESRNVRFSETDEELFDLVASSSSTASARSSALSSSSDPSPIPQATSVPSSNAPTKLNTIPMQIPRDDDPITYDEFIAEDGEPNLKVLAQANSFILQQSSSTSLAPPFSPIRSSDFYELKVHQDSIEASYISQIEDISATLIAVTKFLGPSAATGALLHAHERLKILGISFAFPYSDREAFLTRNGAQSSTFRQSVLKELATARKSAKKSTPRFRARSYNNQNQRSFNSSSNSSSSHFSPSYPNNRSQSFNRFQSYPRSGGYSGGRQYSTTPPPSSQ
jgi:hypothetical protein